MVISLPVAGKLFIPDSQNLLDLVSMPSRLDKTDAYLLFFSDRLITWESKVLIFVIYVETTNIKIYITYLNNDTKN